MKLIRTIAGAIAITAIGSVNAATNFYEGFDDVSTLQAQGWSNLNYSRAPFGDAWFQGVGEFTGVGGSDTGYIATNYLTTVVGTIDNWLITPAITLTGGDTLSFYLQGVPDAPWVDSLRVLVGDGSATTRSDFKTTLFNISGMPDEWTEFTLGLPPTADGSIRIAFEYYGSFTYSNYIGLDEVSVSGNGLTSGSPPVTAVPEPASALLLALGIGGLLVSRRLRPGAARI